MANTYTNIYTLYIKNISYGDEISSFTMMRLKRKFSPSHSFSFVVFVLHNNIPIYSKRAICSQLNMLFDFFAKIFIFQLSLIPSPLLSLSLSASLVIHIFLWVVFGIHKVFNEQNTVSEIIQLDGLHVNVILINMVENDIGDDLQVHLRIY